MPAVKSLANDIGNAASNFFDEAARGFNAANSNCSCNSQPAQSSPEEDSKQNNNNSKQQSSTENQSGQGKSTQAGKGKETGSYTNTHESGATYDGKGSKARSQESGQRVEAETGDKHTATEWKASKNDREAFKDESHRLDAHGGPDSSANHNKIDSPGKKYRQQDGSE